MHGAGELGLHRRMQLSHRYGAAFRWDPVHEVGGRDDGEMREQVGELLGWESMHR